jgi:diguanylate cyclase (GGDEF)-like protein
MLKRLRSPFRSVRSRFSFAMGVSGILFGLILSSFMEWRWESDATTGAQRNLHLAAQKIARSLSEDLSNRQQEIMLMADWLGSTPQASPAQVRALLDRLQQRQPDYAWIGLADARGRVQAATAGLLEQQDVSARPWFQAGLMRPYLGDPHEALLLAKALPAPQPEEPLRFVDVAVPVAAPERTPGGVLGAHLHWHWVQSLVAADIADLQTTAPVEVLIADHLGHWLHKPTTEAAANLAALDSASASNGHFSMRAEVKVGANGPDLAWTVLVRQPTREVLAPIRWNRMLTLLFSLALAVVFAGITWLVSGRVVRPIVALADQARSHQSGLSRPPAPVTHRRRDETDVLGQVMHQLAFYDSVTGLANRRMLLERLTQSLEACAQDHHHGAILLINLDNFSLLNDTRGHKVGDELLTAVARRLPAVLQPQDMLARLGSDEFVLLLHPLGPELDAAALEALGLAERILRSFQHNFELAGETYVCKASIGVAMFSEHDTSMVEVLKHADMAMFEAKRAGRNRVQFFDASMQTLMNERFLLENQLSQAVPQDLALVFQRQVDHLGALLGAEVLVRWRHPSLGMVAPSRFIPLAEESGLILPMGQWVLENACRQLKRWQGQAETEHLVLAINVSVKEFSQPDYVQQVRQVLNRTQANPARLKLELTESILATDVDGVVLKMNALRADGVSFALDDFGTGFSSLAYLQKMPLDQLKIDQSFVRDVTTNPNDAAIVRTVIALGQSLNLTVMAEGVETPEQREFLVQSGCHKFQGYLFGEPVPLEELERQLRPPPVL